jgi:hypothetical protein
VRTAFPRHPTNAGYDPALSHVRAMSAAARGRRLPTMSAPRPTVSDHSPRTDAVVGAGMPLGAPDRARLAAWGLTARAYATPAPTLTDAVRLAAGCDALLAIGARPHEWQRRGPEILADVRRACRDQALLNGLVGLLLPAVAPPGSGPVAAVSPAGTAAPYEMYVAAALAAAAGRAVEHLNAAGAQTSAYHDGFAARAVARGLVAGWREHSGAATAALPRRPSAVVVPVTDDPVAAVDVVAGHPDADVLLLVDVVSARRGPLVGQQVGAMVELALGARTAHRIPEPTRPLRVVTEPASAIRASDVVHIRLTDTALELTNRTRERLELRVELGSEEQAWLALDWTLAPGESTCPTVPGLEALEPPRPVLRRWSHSTEHVYEGGRRRIHRVTAAAVDDAGRPRRARSYPAPAGLDFLLTSRELADLLGATAPRRELPEPAPTSGPAVPLFDLWGALRAALAVGASALDG